jgi:1,2-phenylacetyl-CoA epoxidase PaaB subunit
MAGNLLSTQGGSNRRAENVCHENERREEAFGLFCVRRSNIMSAARKSINPAD